MASRHVLARILPWALTLLGGLSISSAPAADSIDPATPRVRIQHQIPDPRSETVLRDWIADITQGKPDYSTMSADLAKQVSRHLSPLQAGFVSLGKVAFIRFLRVDDQGMDIYQVRQLRGMSKFAIQMAPDGRIERLQLRGELFSTPTMPPPRPREAAGEPLPTD